MSASAASAAAALRAHRGPRLRRIITRISGYEEREFVLQIVQPSLVGMIDGTVSTLAPIFAAAVSSFHSLPFLIGDVNRALIVAGIVVAIELFAIACVRHRFLHVSLRSSLVVVTLGGAIVLAIGVAIGSA